MTTRAARLALMLVLGLLDTACQTALVDEVTTAFVPSHRTVEKGEFVDAPSKQVVFSYAHPIFWAPFTLIGDSGGDPSGR